jgi:hypothetical protein
MTTIARRTTFSKQGMRGLVALPCLAFGALAAYAPDADAHWVRQNSFACWSDHGFDYNWGVDAQFQDANVLCPAPDSDYQPKNGWNAANVEAWVPAGQNLLAEACYASWNGEQGGCSPQIAARSTDPNNGAHVTINLHQYIGKANSWWNTNGGTDFGHIWVYVPNGGRLAGVFYGT